jgi:CDP-diacylglycerol--glycerol-3-phosphate 3-phosphatidyltransferase
MTSARLLMAIAAAVLFAAGRSEFVAVALCVGGALLDAFDGWYARRFAQCSHLGKFLDPLADKILMLVVYGVIAIHIQSLLVWTLFALVMGRDIVVTVSRTLCLRKQGSSYAAGWIGKTKMIVQSIVGLALLCYAYVFNIGFSPLYYPVVITLLVITILSYLSAGRYLVSGVISGVGGRSPS